jgi:hypothetical protein
VKSQRKIAVVGSGPVGVTVATKLVKYAATKLEVFLLDSAQSEGSETLLVDLYDANVHGRKFPDKFFQNLDFLKTDSANFQLIGGYSNVWGGTWESQIRYGHSFESSYAELRRLLSEIKGNIGSLTFSTVLLEAESLCNCFAGLQSQEQSASPYPLNSSELLLNEIRLASNDGKEREIFYSPWNSRTALEFLKGFPNFHSRWNTWVKSFKEINEKVLLETSQGLLEFDYVIFACGPIETSKLILRSLEDINSIHIPDTQMSYSLLIRRPVRKSESRLGLSHVISEITNDEKNLVELHTQYYAHLYQNRSLILRRLHKSLWIPTALLLKLLNPFLVVAINYISSEKSGSLTISRDNVEDNRISIKENSTINDGKEFRRIYSILAKKLRRVGLFTNKWLVIHQAPGKSFHLGANTSGIASKYGKILGCSKSYISGALGLPFLLPGPITSSAMSHGVMVATEVIKELERD